MKCVIMDEETIFFIRSALNAAKRKNISSAKTALVKLDSATLIEQITGLMDSLSTSESDSYVYSDELHRLQHLRSAIEAGQNAAEDYLLIKNHIKPGAYCADINRQMHQLLDKGFTDFILPNDDIVEQMEDEELAKVSVKQLRAARALLDCKRQALARRAGVDVSVIVDYELHDREPEPKARRAIIAVLKKNGISFTNGGVEVNEGN